MCASMKGGRDFIWTHQKTDWHPPKPEGALVVSLTATYLYLGTHPVAVTLFTSQLWHWSVHPSCRVKIALCLLFNLFLSSKSYYSQLQIYIVHQISMIEQKTSECQFWDLDRNQELPTKMVRLRVSERSIWADFFRVSVIRVIKNTIAWGQWFVSSSSTTDPSHAKRWLAWGLCYLFSWRQFF